MLDRLTKSLILVMLALVAGFSLAAHAADTLKIAAAADLEPVLPPLLSEFRQQTSINAEVSYASSATLTTQIVNGAPFDLFLAADLSFPQKVIAAGLADSPTPIPYARGTLVLWTRKDSPVGGESLSLATLKSPAVRTIAVANAEHAPYGRAALAALKSLGLLDTLQKKLVVAENIAQTAQYADSGNASVGLISLTSALTPRLSSAGEYFVMPANSYPPILQGAVVLKRGAGIESARRFLTFLRSPAVQKQLAGLGLQAP